MEMLDPSKQENVRLRDKALAARFFYFQNNFTSAINEIATRTFTSSFEAKLRQFTSKTYDGITLLLIRTSLL